VYGNFISGTERNIIFQDQNGVRRRFDTNQVQNLDFDAVSAPASGLPGEAGRRDRQSENNADRVDGRYEGMVLPAGTQISVRANEAISADTASEGRSYSATINTDVVDSLGRIAIPRGSEARLLVRNVNPGGTLSSGSLALDLQSVSVNGHPYTVSTTDIEKGNDRGLGTLLGAIAGGGKGAPIGAAAGAAAGAGAQVLTKGDKVRVPAETVLNFRLDQPLRLRSTR